MRGDLWGEVGSRTRTGILADFSEGYSIKNYSRMRIDKQERLGQAQAIIRIEKFVTFLLRKNGPAYRFKVRKEFEFTETRIGKRLRKILHLNHLFDSDHVYSEKPSAFIRACRQASLMPGFKLIKPVRNQYEADLAYAEMMNFIVDMIRKLAAEKWFKRCVHDRHYQASCNGKSAARYVADVLNYYARTLIVRLDLGYVGGEAASVTIDRIWSDLNDFIDLLYRRPLFEHLVGHMWSLEQGDDGKGYHVHLVLFFNGSEVCRDIKMGHRIGREIWEEEITQGRGNFYNCNAHKDRYSYVGIGMIHRDNADECMKAIRCLQYLPKSGEFLVRDDQYLRIKPKALMHTFATGQAPDVREKKRGRPAAPAPWFDAWEKTGKINPESEAVSV